MSSTDFEGRNTEFRSLYFSEHVSLEVVFINPDPQAAPDRDEGTTSWFVRVRKSNYSQQDGLLELVSQTYFFFAVQGLTSWF